MAKSKATAGGAGNAGTADDLERLREAAKLTYTHLREIDEDDLPPDRMQEYWRNRYIARTAWEHAENAAFAVLVAQQLRELPAVSASTRRLADDVQRAADAVAIIDLVSASLGTLASVIALLA